MTNCKNIDTFSLKYENRKQLWNIDNESLQQLYFAEKIRNQVFEKLLQANNNDQCNESPVINTENIRNASNNNTNNNNNNNNNNSNNNSDNNTNNNNKNNNDNSDNDSEQINIHKPLRRRIRKKSFFNSTNNKNNNNNNDNNVRNTVQKPSIFNKNNVENDRQISLNQNETDNKKEETEEENDIEYLYVVNGKRLPKLDKLPTIDPEDIRLVNNNAPQSTNIRILSESNTEAAKSNTNAAPQYSNIERLAQSNNKAAKSNTDAAPQYSNIKRFAQSNEEAAKSDAVQKNNASEYPNTTRLAVRDTDAAHKNNATQSEKKANYDKVMKQNKNHNYQSKRDNNERKSHANSRKVPNSNDSNKNRDNNKKTDEREDVRDNDESQTNMDEKSDEKEDVRVMQNTKKNNTNKTEMAKKRHQSNNSKKRKHRHNTNNSHKNKRQKVCNDGNYHVMTRSKRKKLENDLADDEYVPTQSEENEYSEQQKHQFKIMQQTVHHGVLCFTCKKTIIGVKYLCLICSSGKNRKSLPPSVSYCEDCHNKINDCRKCKHMILSMPFYFSDDQLRDELHRY